MKQVVVNVEHCLGCKSCELACAVAHSSAKDLKVVIQVGEKPQYRVHVEACARKAVPIHCNHCEDAPCVSACPTGAVHREEQTGLVLVDVKRCIGCRMCVQACPFGVITMSAEGKGVVKCDQCVERLAMGEEPACVDACPTRALVYAEEKEASRAKRRKTADKMAASALEER